MIDESLITQHIRRSLVDDLISRLYSNDNNTTIEEKIEAKPKILPQKEKKRKD